MLDIESFWTDILEQNAEALKGYFCENAYVNWHNTNEHFTAEEFIRANCEYPGKWAGEIQRKEVIGDLIITAVHVYSCSGDKALSFHVTSFIRIEGDTIAAIDEYWGDDGEPPQWRLDKHIGKPIR